MNPSIFFFGSVFATGLIVVTSILGIDTAILLAIGGVWLRMEHRLTELENKVGSLPCKK